ncbi:DNA polymerase III subunit gamma/tau [bacterium]|nr:DNA polymerase III subunit gamma/tau [bacterium]
MSTSLDPSSSADYTVLARRYRPGRFEDCVGQEHVAQALRNAIDSQRVAHAYLFCGSRGVGKTSMARIFAKALNCVNGPTGQPCGQCESCLAITAGSDLDVVEIDGASNRGIEEIRELRAGVAYRPSRARFKIYIIDEVHMLTKEAFNALLKTLEEPPAHVKFVFATTEAQKIPITILSRCQRYDFAGIGLEQIRQRLAEIVQSEGMTADDDALDMVARRARGSMRDSQSLLDQVLAYASGELTGAIVQRLLGTAGEERVWELGQAIFAQDATTALRLVDQAVAEGVQLGEWLDQMLDFFRDLMVLSVDPSAGILSMGARRRPELIALLDGQSTERIMEMMDLLASARQRLRSSPFGRTIVEMTYVRLCRLEAFMSLTELAQQPLARGLTPGPVLAETGADTRAKKNSPVVSEPPQQKPHRPAPLTHPIAQTTSVFDAAEPATDPASIEPLSAELIKNRWPAVIKVVKDPFLSATLQQISQVRLELPQTVVMTFPATATVSKNRCEGSADVIRDAWTTTVGQGVTVRFEQAPPDPEARVTSSSRSPLQLRDEASRDPVVQQAEMLLGARIFDVVVLPSAGPPGVMPGVSEDDGDKRS